MIHDPIVDEVRQAREEFAKRFNYDLDAMCADLERRQREGGRKCVALPPKPQSKLRATILPVLGKAESAQASADAN